MPPQHILSSVRRSQVSARRCAIAATAATVVALTVVALPAAAQPLGTRQAQAKTVTITVRASEFKFALSKSKVTAGTTVKFVVRNVGKVPHDFKIKGKKTPLIAPGKSASLNVKFTKKGTYAYVCTVPGHARLGMKGNFRVI
jgi:uncharacterized cupredoxin-like copper-binding protein